MSSILFLKIDAKQYNHSAPDRGIALERSRLGRNALDFVYAVTALRLGSCPEEASGVGRVEDVSVGGEETDHGETEAASRVWNFKVMRINNKGGVSCNLDMRLLVYMPRTLYKICIRLCCRPSKSYLCTQGSLFQTKNHSR